MYCSTYSRQIDQEGSLRIYKLIVILTSATSVTDTLATSAVGFVEDHFELSELKETTLRVRKKRNWRLVKERKLRSVLVEERG